MPIPPQVTAALSATKSGLGTGLKYLLGEKRAPWLLPTFGVAAAAPVLGYSMDAQRQADARQKLEEAKQLEASSKLNKIAAVMAMARQQAGTNSMISYPTMRPTAPKGVLSPYPAITAPGLKAQLTPATK